MLMKSLEMRENHIKKHKLTDFCLKPPLLRVVKASVIQFDKSFIRWSCIEQPLLHVFISCVIQCAKYFHPVALYENYLICIFMNINENLKMRENPLDELASQEVIRPTLNT